MNLELIDPFGRQIPDRIDATFQLPAPLHFRNSTSAAAAAAVVDSKQAQQSSSSSKKGGGGKASSLASSSAKNSSASPSSSDEQEWKAAFHVTFNRRGTYLAVGYGSGTVAVFHAHTRSLSALYPSDDPDVSPNNVKEGVTSATWSRRSRTVLAGAAGDDVVRLFDATHRFGPDEACHGLTDHPLHQPAFTAGATGGGGIMGGDALGDGDDDTAASPAQIAAPKVSARATAAASTSANATAGGKQRVTLPNLIALDSKQSKNTLFVDPCETTNHPSGNYPQWVWSNERCHLSARIVRPGTTLRSDSHQASGPSQSTSSQIKEADADPSSLVGRKRSRSMMTKEDAIDDESEKGSDPQDAGTASEDRPTNTDEPSVHPKKGTDAETPQDVTPLEDYTPPTDPKPSAPAEAPVKPWHRHPCVSLTFPHPVGGALQVCPRVPTGGLAALSDGSLVLFWVPPQSFVSSSEKPSMDLDDSSIDHQNDENALLDPENPRALIVPLWNDDWITCAAFDHHGDRVFAATKNGTLLGFRVADVWLALQGAWAGTGGPSGTLLPKVEPHFRLAIGGSTAWHLLVSRNGKYLVVNSSDGALRLFRTKDVDDCDASGSPPPKPLVFQDVVSKVKFVCCDLSGDGEYLVGGANGDDNKYELYIWNTTTGALLDKLTGPPVQLYSLAWHPARSFLAVATSDGLIDVWGPRINWTAFAPDFQALPMNVEYIEQEDEFDVDADGRYLATFGEGADDGDHENATVDVTNIEKVPVFESDSESEEDVFHYELRLVNLLAERRGKKAVSVDD